MDIQAQVKAIVDSIIAEVNTNIQSQIKTLANVVRSWATKTDNSKEAQIGKKAKAISKGEKLSQAQRDKVNQLLTDLTRKLDSYYDIG